MTPERFNALVDAYGADARRWPVSERAAAEAFMATHPEAADAALAEADEIDALLHGSKAPSVSMALRDRVIAAAATSGMKAGRNGRRWLNRVFLMAGAGWAAAACAGVVAGLGLTTHLTADAQADAVLYQASLDAADDTEWVG